MSEQDDKDKIPTGRLSMEWLNQPDQLPEGMTEQEFKTLCLERDREAKNMVAETIAGAVLEGSLSPEKADEITATVHEVFGPDPEDIQ